MNLNSIETIFAIQELDLEIDRLNSKLESHPISDEVTSATQKLESLSASHKLLMDEHANLATKIAKQTPKLVDLRLKREAQQAKMYDGSVTSQKELDSLNGTIEFISSEIDELETSQLVDMESSDAMLISIEDSQNQVEKATYEVEDLESKLSDALAVATQELYDVNDKRANLAPAADPDLFAAYTKLRDNSVQKPFAQLVGGSCDGCHMAVAAVNVDRLKNWSGGPPEHCDECSRVLVP